MRYNLSGLESMEILYQGAVHGVWNGDFIKNEKQRNLKLGFLQKEFLSKYGYFPINKNGSCLFGPDIIASVSGIEPFYVVGKLREYDIFVPVAAIEEDDPVIFIIHPEQPYLYLGNPEDFEENGSIDDALVRHNFVRTNLKMSDYLKNLFREKMYLVGEGELVEENDALKQLISEKELDVSKLNVRNNAEEGTNLTICYEETSHIFYFVETNTEGNVISVLVCKPRKAIGLEKFRTLSLEDLRGLLNKEFYQNSLHCDYACVLEILQELILRLEAKESEISNRKTCLQELAGYFQIGGTCCWKLKDLEGADTWYQKAADAFENCKEICFEEVIHFYIGQGNYFFNRNLPEKSRQCYERAAELCEQYSPEDYSCKGRIYQLQGENKMAAQKPEEAFLFYEKALEIYKLDTKGCKYDIARCSQLRGEAKRQSGK